MKKIDTYIDPETGEKITIDLGSEYVGILTAEEARKKGITDNRSSSAAIINSKLFSNNDDENNSIEDFLDNRGLHIIGDERYD